MGIIIFLSLFFVMHYSLIVLKVGPINPISLKAKPLTQWYTSKLFDQNWHLFAPEPVNTNPYIYMQVDTGDLKENEWIDISTPLIEQNQSKIFTPYNRVVRIVEGLTSELTGNTQDDLIYKYLNKAPKDDKQHEKYRELVENSVELAKENGEKNLYRYASSYSKALYPKVNIKKIRVKVMIYDTIPFSERGNSEAQPVLEREITLEWKTPENEIVKFY